MAKHEFGSLGNPTEKYSHALKTTCKIHWTRVNMVDSYVASTKKEESPCVYEAKTTADSYQDYWRLQRAVETAESSGDRREQWRPQRAVETAESSGDC